MSKPGASGPDTPDTMEASAPRLSPAWIAVIYAAVSLIYIYFSDQLLELIVQDSSALTRLQTYKGTAFVLLSALMLYGLTRKAVRSAQLSEQGLKSLLANLPQATLVFDRDLRCVRANRQAATLLDLPIAELFTTIHELSERAHIVQGANEESLAKIAERTLSGESLRDLDRTIRAKDGQTSFIRIHTAPVNPPECARPELAVIVFQDVTPILRLEKLRDDFLTTAAHEMKSPMATIKAYVQLLGRSRPEWVGEKELQSFAVLDRQCDRMDRLVRELVEFSRLQVGRLELNRENFDLSELCSQVGAQMQKISAKHEVRCETSGPVRVTADPGRIEQVLTNLIDNAIKFSPQGGPVRLQVSSGPKEITISVIDQGWGIPPDKRSRLFQRYYRAHSDLADRAVAGMGMGLFICRELIERHGGRIWHEEAQPQGSAFRFTLPTQV